MLTGLGAIIPNPGEPHRWGECMEDWHDYEWRKWIVEEERRFRRDRLD